MAPVVLPYLNGRPRNLHRYPDGAERPGFWHKQRPQHAPAWLGSWDNDQGRRGETTTYVVADEPAALVWAANVCALEWHPWTSTAERPDEPTYALIDLDPGERTRWEDLLVLARLHRTALDHLGVTARAKVTGRRGIQIWVPIVPGDSFDDTRAWVERLSRTVGEVVPELVSWKWEVKARRGLARLDYTQNAINKTLVAPYSPRTAAGAPVSVPITWDELDDPELRPDRWSVRTVPDRLATKGRPFPCPPGCRPSAPRPDLSRRAGPQSIAGEPMSTTRVSGDAPHLTETSPLVGPRALCACVKARGPGYDEAWALRREPRGRR